MENEKEVKKKNVNKFLIALIVLTSVNLLVGIINIGLITKNNIRPRNERHHMRQEMMFDGCDYNNKCPMMGRGGNRQFMNRPFGNTPNFPNRNENGDVTRNQRPNGNWQNNMRQHNDNNEPQNNNWQNNMRANNDWQRPHNDNQKPQNNKPEMNSDFNRPQ